MSGQMGNVRTTARAYKIVRVDAERNLLLRRGRRTGRKRSARARPPVDQAAEGQGPRRQAQPEEGLMAAKKTGQENHGSRSGQARRKSQAKAAPRSPSRGKPRRSPPAKQGSRQARREKENEDPLQAGLFDSKGASPGPHRPARAHLRRGAECAGDAPGDVRQMAMRVRAPPRPRIAARSPAAAPSPTGRKEPGALATARSANRR